MTIERPCAPGLSRRGVLLGGGATAIGGWIAPSVVGFDKVAAATGSCAAASIQIDWTDHAPTGALPNQITANDGTIVQFGLMGDTNLLINGWAGAIRAEQRGGLWDYMAIGMANATNGAGVTLRMKFSKPVQVCFMLLDVDRATNSWEDSFAIDAWDNNGPVAINPANLVMQGPAVVNVPPNAAVGVSSEPNNSTLANVDFQAPSPVTAVDVHYWDDSPWTGGQAIGIHDFRWCATSDGGGGKDEEEPPRDEGDGRR